MAATVPFTARKRPEGGPRPRPSQELFGLGFRHAVALAADGKVTVEALIRSLLERIAEIEPAIGAWQHLDEAQVLASARRADHGPKGPLYGGVFGAKDVLATADMPTGYGSRAYLASRPACDASAIAIPRSAGAVLLGKTVTTEFAALSPGPTRNPFNADHTPGGSSSGSAAAVAAKMVPVALGTQTAGSTIRPASFCGVVGYKPSFGLIDTAGMKELAAGLDTIGIFARDVEDAAYFAAAITSRPGLALPSPSIPRVGIYMTEAADLASAETLSAIEMARRACERRGAFVRDIPLTPGYDRLLDLHEAIFDWAMLRALAYERLSRRHDISAVSLRMFEDRERTANVAAFDAAQRDAVVARSGIDRLFGSFDVILTPAAPGEAPLGLESTGDASFNRGWSLLHTPCVSVPAGMGPNELPVGVQIVGRPGDDERTLSAAIFLQAALAGE